MLLLLIWSTSLVEYLILGSSFVNKVIILSRLVFKEFCHEPHCSFLAGNGWIACQDKWRRERDSWLSWSRLRSQFETRIMTAATHSQLYLIHFEREKDSWLSYKASFFSIWNHYYDSSRLIHSCIWNILQQLGIWLPDWMVSCLLSTTVLDRDIAVCLTEPASSSQFETCRHVLAAPSQLSTFLAVNIWWFQWNWSEICPAYQLKAFLGYFCTCGKTRRVC